MRTLGIETSCDETSVALLEMKGGVSAVRGQFTASQVLDHAEYGGVVPEVAARLHVQALPAIMRRLGLGSKDVDGIAITRGPGLITSLRVGVDFARGLAWAWKKPIVGVNHIEGHIAANFIGSDVRRQMSDVFPAVVLVVSGGHTEIIFMKNFGRYERLGSTLDDAAGEAFDKVAKMLDLGYPGGPAVSERAEKGDPERFILPRPMLSAPNFDFSFSGLKTAVLYTIQRKEKWNARDIDDLCASFQKASVDVLVAKTVRAAHAKKARTVFLAGGVAANKMLRERLAAECQMSDVRCRLPDLQYCTDNAAMIAMAGSFRLARPLSSRAKSRDDWKMLAPDPNWEL